MTLTELLSPDLTFATALNEGGNKPPVFFSKATKETGTPSRCTLKHKGLLNTQLRAILRFKAYSFKTPLVPVGADISELRALTITEDQGQSRAGPSGSIDVGTIFEVSTAKLSAVQLTDETAFVAINISDLGPSDLAMEREDPTLASNGNALHSGSLPPTNRVANMACFRNQEVVMCS